MPNSLTTYIDSSRKLGLTDSDIRQKLITAGWSEIAVNGALAPTASPAPNPELAEGPPPPPAPIHVSGNTFFNWDAFEHILMFLSLYTLLIAVGMTLNLFAEKLFPAVKSGLYGNPYSYVTGYYTDSIYVGVLSAMIVSLPLFSLLYFNIIKRTAKNPMLRHIIARKRLIYITLIITFFIMMGNLISILTSFLNGNFVVNSLAHFVATVGPSLVVFIYYLNLVSEDKNAEI